MYKGKTFVVKAGGGVFADTESTRVLIEQIAILALLRSPRRDGSRRRTAGDRGSSEALGVSNRMVEGRRVTDEKSIDVTAMVLKRPHQHPHSRHLP